MKIIDIIFALIAGRIIGFLIGDFLREWGIHLNIYYVIVLWVALPFLALLVLWIASLAGRKLLFIFQGAKHLLVGAVATVFDLKFFEWLIWMLSFVIAPNPMLAKSISFLFSTLVKYWGNKYWAFSKPENEDLHKEMLNFFFITLLGLIIDVGIFYYLTKAIGPQMNFSPAIWTKLAVIFAAAGAALWNFLGYKLLVFKK